MFLRNCWYMAGWSDDFADGSVTPFTILDNPLVIYRKDDGGLAVLEDRCVHRAAPLSKGRQEGDGLRCMYHGLKFGPDGACTDLPGQDVIPKSVCVRSFPVVEAHGGAWVWMGDPALADTSIIPHVVGPGDAYWNVGTSHLDIEADAQLLIDNLLDVGHAPYVHERTFAGGNQDNVARMVQAELDSVATRLERGVRVERWIKGREHNPFLGGITTDDLAHNEVLVPGVFVMHTRCYAAGTAERTGGTKAPNDEPLLERIVGQVVTPVSAGRCKLFFTGGTWARTPDFAQRFFGTVRTAFLEDEDIIVAQQKIIDLTPDRGFVALNMDGPLKRYEAIVKRLKDGELASVA